MTTKRRKADTCKVDGCKADVYTRGLCALHWCSRADLADQAPEPEPSRLAQAARKPERR